MDLLHIAYAALIAALFVYLLAALWRAEDF